MAAIAGMLTIEDLEQHVAAGTIDSVVVGFTDIYGRLMGKRFDARFFLDDVARHGTHACGYLLTVDMEMEPVPGYRFANWEAGYGDVLLRCDLDTLRLTSWQDRTAMVLCDVYDDHGHKLVPQAPRSMLRRQIERAAGLGFQVMASSELEYYLFTQSYRDAAAKAYRGLEPVGWYLEDYNLFQGTRGEPFHGAARRYLQKSGVPVESSKGEWGLGQHELNVRYADVLTMSDRHVVFKQCLKETAEQMGMSVTFMAKYAADQAGSSCHLHLSLWQQNRNAFAGDREFGPVRGSESFGWFLAGWISHVPELMVFLAPTVNSYKRFRPGSWAPTRLAWSYDNRTAGFRVVGADHSLRIECRIPGADCNPYLAFAASLAAGLDGVARRLHPPPHFAGDMYAAGSLPHVPQSLREATDLFSRSDFARETFGGDVVEHYVHFFRTEQENFERSVTDWERHRYFERI
jgi:glutamine synthetase